jgi:hypothetical protein
MNGLIGYTGFVGSNILKTLSIKKKFNSKNINLIHKYNFNILFCAAPSSLKFYANKYPKKDKKNILNLIKILKKVNCRKFIQISTIDVYNQRIHSNEISKITDKKLSSYGKNRRLLEKFIIKNFKDYHIIRLPNLIGENLKKNVIYDIVNKKKIFINLNSIQQWYNLRNFKKDIKVIINNKIKCINLVSEPIPIKEIIKNFSIPKITNKYEQIKYNIKSKYSNLFNKKNYIYYKKDIILEIINYIKKNLK